MGGDESHLWRDDVEEVPCQSVLLGKHVVVVRLEGDAEHVDDEGAGGQVEGDAVLPQKAPQLGALLPQELQRHLGPWNTMCSFSKRFHPDEIYEHTFIKMRRAEETRQGYAMVKRQAEKLFVEGWWECEGGIHTHRTDSRPSLF